MYLKEQNGISCIKIGLIFFGHNLRNDIEAKGLHIDKMKFEFDVIDDKKPEKGDCEN